MNSKGPTIQSKKDKIKRKNEIKQLHVKMDKILLTSERVAVFITSQGDRCEQQTY